MAMSAKMSALGISVTAVSATRTVRPRASTSDTPITRWPGLGSMQQRRPKSLVNEARRGADDLLFFAFGEHDPLRTSPQPLVNALEKPGYWVAPRAQLRPVSIHIDDRSPGHAAVHGGSGDGGGNERDQPRVERDRNDVFGPIFRPDAIRGGDLIGNILSR